MAWCGGRNSAANLTAFGDHIAMRSKVLAAPEGWFSHFPPRVEVGPKNRLGSCRVLPLPTLSATESALLTLEIVLYSGLVSRMRFHSLGNSRLVLKIVAVSSQLHVAVLPTQSSQRQAKLDSKQGDQLTERRLILLAACDRRNQHAHHGSQRHNLYR